ncbi:MAG: SDR family oxidoreductase [Alphaproteobacteria bacterium]|jgi:nucleoside-diphosphate-sugar epimerase|nr:SDR family oxidoreductase [Alphaproteobacteria bacterium]
MKVFITGATGFIGSRIVDELLKLNHKVIGLTRSDLGASILEKKGAEAHFGTLEDCDSIVKGADKADAVIHAAFDHNFANFVENCNKDKRVIEAVGKSLVGSSRPLIITSGTPMGSLKDGDIAKENVFNPNSFNPRVATEIAGNAMRDLGVDVRVARLPQVHNTEKQGLITPLINISKAKGLAAYIGNGDNHFPAANVEDVAKLYTLILEKGEKGGVYNAVAEEGIPIKRIMQEIGVRLNIPVKSLPKEEAEEHFGWLARIVSANMLASSEWTRKTLDWNPTGTTLLEDLANMDYSKLNY